MLAVLLAWIIGFYLLIGACWMIWYLWHFFTDPPEEFEQWKEEQKGETNERPY